MYFCSQKGCFVNSLGHMRRVTQRPKHRPRWGLPLRCGVAAFGALALAVIPELSRATSALLLLARLTGQHTLDPLADRMLAPIVERDTPLHIGGKTFRARRYAPADVQSRRPGVLLLHGVHPRGIDERHLVDFARTLAAGGLDVLTPELPELLAYRLGGTTIEDIRLLAHAHARATHTPAVGAIGISFAGGLALMAAAGQGDPASIAFVVSVGGHHDLLRLCRYYAGDDVRGPNGERVDVAPHPYGARVMIREHLDRFVASEDLELARRALDAYLRDRHDEARRLALGLSPSAQRVMAVLLDTRQREALAQLLRQAVDRVRPQLMAASPSGHLGQLHVPVFLVHGAGDPIIPSIETAHLAAELPRVWLRQTVITPLLRHTEFPEPPKLSEAWQLVRFLKGIYEAAGSSLRRVATTGP
jgi:pimeloyl-ACP methyl ester carboxylesterase